MMAHYDRYRQTSKNPYIEAFFKLTGASLSIYTSGKVVFREMAEQEAGLWGYEPEKSGQTTIPGQNLPMIGTDEVGNGSYFGGLAVVASFVRPEDHAFLKSLGVDDSKKMTDQNICQIAPLLKKIPTKLCYCHRKIQRSHRARLQCGVCQGRPTQSGYFPTLTEGCPA